MKGFPGAGFSVWRDDLVKTSLSDKYKASCVGVRAGFVPGLDILSPCMGFAENDQAHKGF